MRFSDSEFGTFTAFCMRWVLQVLNLERSKVLTCLGLRSWGDGDGVILGSRQLWSVFCSNFLPRAWTILNSTQALLSSTCRPEQETAGCSAGSRLFGLLHVIAHYRGREGQTPLVEPLSRQGSFIQPKPDQARKADRNVAFAHIWSPPP